MLSLIETLAHSEADHFDVLVTYSCFHQYMMATVFLPMKATVGCQIV